MLNDAPRVVVVARRVSDNTRRMGGDESIRINPLLLGRGGNLITVSSRSFTRSCEKYLKYLKGKRKKGR